MKREIVDLLRQGPQKSQALMDASGLTFTQVLKNIDRRLVKLEGDTWSFRNNQGADYRDPLIVNLITHGIGGSWMV